MAFARLVGSVCVCVTSREKEKPWVASKVIYMLYAEWGQYAQELAKLIRFYISYRPQPRKTDPANDELAICHLALEMTTPADTKIPYPDAAGPSVVAKCRDS